MKELTLAEQRVALAQDFSGKNLTIHVKKGSVSIIKNYTIVDRSQSSVKDVFEKFAKIIIGALGKILIVNKAIGLDQQSEKLTFDIERDGENVYTFEASYKEFKKYFSGVLTAEALVTLGERGLWENDNLTAEIHNNATGYDTLMLLQRIALTATHIAPSNAPLQIATTEA